MFRNRLKLPSAQRFFANRNFSLRSRFKMQTFQFDSCFFLVVGLIGLGGFGFQKIYLIHDEFKNNMEVLQEVSSSFLLANEQIRVVNQEKSESEERQRVGLKLVHETLLTKREDWNLSPIVQYETLAAMTFDHAFGALMLDFPTNRESLEYNHLMIFLYCAAPTVFQPPVRLDAFKSVLNPTSPDHELPSGKLSRLKEIVLFGERHEEMPKLTSLDVFLKKHQEWADPETSFVFFRDAPSAMNKSGVYVERIQSRGLCSMHAPVALQHYLLSMQGKDGEIKPMLDLGLYLRRFLRGYDLHDHVWRSTGLNSLSFLKTILEPDSKVLTISSVGPDTSEEILAQALANGLREYGPGLLSSFQTEVYFSDLSQWRHAGKPVSPFVGLHSMVVIGFRTGQDKRFFLLLQSWWKGKEIVEIDVEYLRNCWGEVHFVMTPQVSYAKIFPFQTGNCVVSCGELDTTEAIDYKFVSPV